MDGFGISFHYEAKTVQFDDRTKQVVASPMGFSFGSMKHAHRMSQILCAQQHIIV